MRPRISVPERLAIPNSDANGDLFPECRRRGGGTGFGRLSNDVKLSPNPVLKNGEIQIQGLEKFNIESVEIVDMFGNIKSTQKTDFNNLRLGNLNTGIYFVKISTKQGVIQKKIIVN